jgi:hypothetical protein
MLDAGVDAISEDSLELRRAFRCAGFLSRRGPRPSTSTANAPGRHCVDAELPPGAVRKKA